ncbi:MAG: aldo/keto reductase [Silicimonas sp.]|nr:aldo/keto reductase [Silicimonas sp.]
MKRTTLGRTGIEVSDYCLGTMTWGNQTPEAEAHAQIDAALAAGIDFMDTAEMYPVAPKAETIGNTERVIGNWVQKSGRRDDVVIATKHTGESALVRDNKPIGPDTVRDVLEGSLRRLRTDYVDLYQFHWPNRGSFMFRKNWDFDPREQPPATQILDEMAATMEVLGDLVAEGKIRAFGLSNDSAWGTMHWLAAADRAGGPRVATIQNEYSLLCRLYDTDMAELAHHEDITLLAFSPLACGFLTGKYQDGDVPHGSRMSFSESMGGRNVRSAYEATQAYLDIAARHGLDPVHLALAWCVQRPFPTIPIFGATTMAQLETVIAGLDVSLSQEVLDEVSKAHRAHPMPF